ncbi:helix-turn-helix transcriptional regulator [Nonomuraea maritima]|uniref:helix-turn-helix transcriptional regulator n=1 Tax=Nonomuraea maritima TaxID=683260 RepID=UPI00371A9FA9
MAVVARPPFTDRLLPMAAGGAGAATVAALLALRLAGQDGFPTDPVAATALALAAAGAAVADGRLAAAGNRRAGTFATWLCVSLLAYLALAVWAVWAVATGHSTAALAVALWSSAWIPPLGLMQLAVSAAVRASGRAPWTHRVLTSVIVVLTLTNSLLTTPSAPFTGLPTIAPESWRTALEPLGGLATLLGVLTLLLIPISLWRAALGSAGAARARIGVAAAGTTGAPLTLCFCLLLAIARDPGAVEPSLGSAAFLVTLAGAAAFSAACAVPAARGGVRPQHVAIVVRGTGLAASALVVAGIGTLIASPGIRLGATAVALSLAALTLVVVGGAWFGTGRLSRVLAAEQRPVTDKDGPAPVPGLTPREAEVLSVLAEGASNAGIAAQLVVSERTVDAHLRAIFVKLDLKQEPGTNRRVQAARIWLDNAATNRGPGA